MIAFLYQTVHSPGKLDLLIVLQFDSPLSEKQVHANGPKSLDRRPGA